MSPPSAWAASIVQLLTDSPLKWMRARAARRRVAPDVGAGQTDVLPDVLDEQRARLDVVGVLDPVDGDAHFHFWPPCSVADAVGDRSRSRDDVSHLARASGGRGEKRPQQTLKRLLEGVVRRPQATRRPVACGPVRAAATGRPGGSARPPPRRRRRPGSRRGRTSRCRRGAGSTVASSAVPRRPSASTSQSRSRRSLGSTPAIGPVVTIQSASGGGDGEVGRAHPDVGPQLAEAMVRHQSPGTDAGRRAGAGRRRR